MLLTTALWLAALLVCLYLIFRNGLAAWAGQYDDPQAEQVSRQAAHLAVWLAVIAVGGPLLSAGVALVGRFVKTAVVFLVLAALLAVPTGLWVRETNAYLHQYVLEPDQPSGACQEYSGGDTRCPGG